MAAVRAAPAFEPFGGSTASAFEPFGGNVADARPASVWPSALSMLSGANPFAAGLPSAIPITRAPAAPQPPAPLPPPPAALAPNLAPNGHGAKPAAPAVDGASRDAGGGGPSGGSSESFVPSFVLSFGSGLGGTGSMVAQGGHDEGLSEAALGIVNSLRADEGDAHKLSETMTKLQPLVVSEARRWMLNEAPRYLASQPELAMELGLAGFGLNPPQLLAYGSAASRLGQHGSDLDVTLLFEPPGPMGATVVLDVELQRSLIGHLHRALLSHALSSPVGQWLSVEALQRPGARYPLLRLIDARTRMRVDLSVCQHLGVLNTALVRAYTELTPVVPQLALFVKLWSQRRRVNEPTHGMLSSYTWSLLVIFSLQARAGLPSLQAESLTSRVPRRYVRRDDGATFDCTFHEQPLSWALGHTVSLGQALRTFFDFWASFDYARHAASVRVGGALPRAAPADGTVSGSASFGWRTFGIEDPFEVTRDLGSVLTDETFAITRAEVQRAAARLHENSNGRARPWAEVFAELLEPRMG